jgi:hypothetical protein
MAPFQSDLMFSEGSSLQDIHKEEEGLLFYYSNSLQSLASNRNSNLMIMNSSYHSYEFQILSKFLHLD